MYRSFARSSLIFGALLLALAAWPAGWLGCGGEEGDEATNPAEAAPDPEPEPEPEAPAVHEHTVSSGDNLSRIARRYQVSIQSIVEANELRPEDVRNLRIGTVLQIPGAVIPEDEEAPEGEAGEEGEAAEEGEAGEEEEPAPGINPDTDPTELGGSGSEEEAAGAEGEAGEEGEEGEGEACVPAEGAEHTLLRGETLWHVAHLYDVSTRELIEGNCFGDEEVRSIRPGTRLRIPGVTPERAELILRRRGREVEPQRTEPVRHEVTAGENIWSLAHNFGVPVSAIMSANGLTRRTASQLRPGTRLHIPGVYRDARGRVQRQQSAVQRSAIILANRLHLGGRQAGQELLYGHARPEWIAAASRGFGRHRFPGTLRWPVGDGWFVRGFGSGEGGYHQAVDIMGQMGWNVRAAARGVVGYSGNELRGFGNTVILIHPGGWLTLYAHNSANLVVAGETVPAGGIIAELGSTGISSGPHVHFEFMFNGENCDPAPLFRPGVLHRSGNRGRVTRATWIDSRSPRPAVVECHPRRRHPNSRWVSHESF